MNEREWRIQQEVESMSYVIRVFKQNGNMNEININIEGYNENGLCITCLNHGRRLIYVEEFERYYKLLADIEIPAELSFKICWECAANMRHIKRFELMARKSFDVLIKYSQKNVYLKSAQDFMDHSTTSLCQKEVLNVSTDGKLTDEEEFQDCIKAEINETVKDELEEFEIKCEAQKVESDYDDFCDNDNITLTQLKQEKIIEMERKKVRRKRKADKISKSVDRGSRKQAGKLIKHDRQIPSEMVKVRVDMEAMLALKLEDQTDESFVSMKNRCEDCLRCFLTADQLAQHRAKKHVQKSESDAKCVLCGVYTEAAKCATHRHEVAYECVACSKRSAFRYCMVRHIRHRHATEPVCQYCGKVFKSNSALHYHKSGCNAEKPQCDCCGKVFANKTTLKNHLSSINGNKKSSLDEETQSITCQMCGKAFSSKKSYSSHAVIHSGRQHPCPTCGVLFQWKRNLARHLRNHRDRDAGTAHSCLQCDKRFTSRDVLSNHIRLKHIEFLNVCPQCGKAFPTKSALYDHMDWDHFKKANYQCKLCDKIYKTSKTLNVHVRSIHEKRNVEPEGRHLCDICGKYYRTQKRLRSHVWAMHKTRHNGHTFKCPLCAAAFLWKTSIYKHLKMVHRDQMSKFQHLIKSGPLKQKLLECYQRAGEK